MKAVKINFKKILVGSMAICMIAFSNEILAANEKKLAGNADLQFVCRVKNLPVFRLNVNNEQYGDFLITIKEENGEILFSEKLKGKKISRVYKLDSEFQELINGTTFEVTDRISKTTTTYKISNFTRVVEDVVVTKM